MKTMRLVIATCAVLAAMSSVAKADLVLVNGTATASFVDLGAQGFGNNPRLLTLQTSPFESGSVTPVDVVHDDAIANNGGNKSNTPTLSVLGWDKGADVGIGLNTGQSGHTGVTLQTLVLTVYNGTTAVGTFSLASPINFTGDELALQQGNGNAVFAFGLNAAQQTQFNTLLLTSGSSGFYAGLSSSIGCAGTPTATCQVANDGPDSFIGFDRAVVSVPDGGTTIGLLGLGLLGLSYVNRKMKA